MLRLGFDIDLSVNEDDAESWQSLDDTLRNERDDNSRTSGQSVAVELLYVMYPWPDSYINFFWGLGPVVSFSRSKQERESDYVYFDSGSTLLNQSYYSRSWSAGLKGAVGGMVRHEEDQLSHGVPVDRCLSIEIQRDRGEKRLYPLRGLQESH